LWAGVQYLLYAHDGRRESQTTATPLFSFLYIILQLSKNEDLQEMEFHLTQPSSSAGSTPWASEKHSVASEPPHHGMYVGGRGRRALSGSSLTHNRAESGSDTL